MTPGPEAERLIRELNAGDVGHEALDDGTILHFEGFTDMCWQAHVERFGEDAAAGVAIVEAEMHADWEGRHTGTRVAASGWEGGSEPWDDCVHWALLVPTATQQNA